MPLSNPVSRKLMHTRMIECKGYERDDGFWDFEAILVDTKAFIHIRRDNGKQRMPGEPVHSMSLRLTIDLEMVVHDAEAQIDASPYPYCPEIASSFKKLIGLKIGAGWRREIAARVGGVLGCTHLVELLSPLGTTAFQATSRARQNRKDAAPTPKKPYQIGSCHVYKEDAPAVLERWPEWYKAKAR